MKGLILVIGVFVSQGLMGQIIDNRDCDAFSDDPFFNEKFIRVNKIKSMKGSISTKNKLQPIQTRGLITYYGFNEDGKLVEQYSTRLKTPTNIDTTFIRYKYNDLNKIAVKRLNDNYGFYSYNYEYDSAGNVVAEEYCRDQNIGKSPIEFELGKQTIIVSETFKNVWVNDKELKRVYYNNYGKPYQEKYQRWDDKGYLIEEETVLLLNRKRNITKYVYDAKGYVVKRTQNSNVTGNSELISEYTYDEVGNLLEINEYRNGRHITKKEVLYTESMLVKAVIILDISSEYMTLIKYEYSFFDNLNTTQN